MQKGAGGGVGDSSGALQNLFCAGTGVRAQAYGGGQGLAVGGGTQQRAGGAEARAAEV